MINVWRELSEGEWVEDWLDSPVYVILYLRLERSISHHLLIVSLPNIPTLELHRNATLFAPPNISPLGTTGPAHHTRELLNIVIKHLLVIRL